MAPQVTAAFAALWVFTLGSYFVALIDKTWSGSMSLIILRVLEFTTLVGATLVAYWIALHEERKERSEVRRRVNLCTRCGYDLRASVDRCPECGHPIDLDSISTRP